MKRFPLLIFSLLVSTSGIVSGNPVSIPDAQLEIAIRSTLNKPTGDLTESDLETLEWLYADYPAQVDTQIESIEGLQFAVNLLVLGLSGNQISDLSPLAELENLGELYFGGNPVSGFSSLQGQSIGVLDLTDGGTLTDLEFLNGIDIRALDLSGTEVEDWSSLSQLTTLRNLTLDQCKFNQLEYLSGLSQLSYLSMNRNEIDDISTLPELNLLGLYLSDNQIEDLSPIARMVALQEFNAAGNLIADLAPLSNLLQLDTLILSDNRIEDLAPLANLTQIDTLKLDRNQIRNLAPLKELSTLSDLNLEENQISGLAPLASLTQLGGLHLAGNRITNLTPLSGLEIRTLTLSDNRISDLSPLANNVSLQILYLDQNLIEDLAPLSALTSMRILFLAHNRISDLSPLSALDDLLRLDLASNRVVDITPLANLTKLSDSTQSGGPVALDLSLNYIDVGTGAAARSTVDALSAMLGVTVIESPQKAGSPGEIPEEGTVIAFGRSNVDQIGAGLILPPSSLYDIQSSGNSLTIQSGDFAFIDRNHTLWGVGNNIFEMFGQDEEWHGFYFPQVIAEQVMGVWSSQGLLVYLTVDRELYGRGNDYPGQFGVAERQDKGEPVLIDQNVNYVGLGDSHLVYSKTDGTLWGCGANGNAQLGTGDLKNRLEPVLLSSDYIFNVAVFGDTTLFINSDDELWGCGPNYYNELGTTQVKVQSPILIAEDVREAFAAGRNIIWIDKQGTAWGMGSNAEGTLGGITPTYTEPKRIMDDVLNVAMSKSYSAFMDSNRQIWVSSKEGDFLYFEQAIGTTLAIGDEIAFVGRDVALRMFPLTDSSYYRPWHLYASGFSHSLSTSIPVPVRDGIVDIAAGQDHSLFLDFKGNVWASGSNSDGQLATGASDVNRRERNLDRRRRVRISLPQRPDYR